MKIIIRTCGERTTKKCIELASKQGIVELVEAKPFAESVRQTYLLAMQIKQKWIPVVDADVLLYPNVIRKAIAELELKHRRIFCLDGKTDDKIMMKRRRAGVHIYRRDLLDKAIQYIDNLQIKPESFVRRMMEIKGYPTHVSKIVFGKHDYEQYYRDLWRKGVIQTRKLGGMIKKHPRKWYKLGKRDLDYLVIFKAHEFGKKVKSPMLMDVDMDYNAKIHLKKLGIREKAPLK